MLFIVYHMRNRGGYFETEEEVTHVEKVPLQELEETVRRLYLSKEFRQGMDWIEIMPEKEDKHG